MSHPYLYQDICCDCQARMHPERPEVIHDPVTEEMLCPDCDEERKRLAAIASAQEKRHD